MKETRHSRKSLESTGATLFAVAVAVLFIALGPLALTFASGEAETGRTATTGESRTGSDADSAAAEASTDTAAAQGNQQSATATFAGGCFWCMEKPFDVLPGVSSTVSGYAGGHLENPSYQDVTSGTSGHAEVVQVTYDPSVTSYEELLYVFWRNVDPLDAGGQFCDRGDSYRTAIFYETQEQRRLARASTKRIKEQFDRPIATEITELDTFYPAEDYHQNYYKENSLRYKLYRNACGRDARLKELWGNEAGGRLNEK